MSLQDCDAAYSGIGKGEGSSTTDDRTAGDKQWLDLSMRVTIVVLLFLLMIYGPCKVNRNITEMFVQIKAI